MARRTRRASSDTLQRWLLIAASVTAVGVWSTFGVLYFKRHASPASSRASLAPAGQGNVSIVISPPTAAPKAAEPGPAAEGVSAATAKAAALPARAAPEAAPAAEAPAAKPTLEAPAAARVPAPAPRPRADEATKSSGSAAKARPAARPRQPGDRAATKKRPIDEGFLKPSPGRSPAAARKAALMIAPVRELLAVAPAHDSSGCAVGRVPPG